MPRRDVGPITPPPVGTIWEKIEAVRTARGMPLSAFSKFVGLSPAAYRNITEDWRAHTGTLEKILTNLREKGLMADPNPDGATRSPLEVAAVAADELAGDWGLSSDEAWKVMRDMRGAEPTVHGYYREAVRKLRRPQLDRERTPELDERSREAIRSSRPPAGRAAAGGLAKGATRRSGKSPSRS